MLDLKVDSNAHVDFLFFSVLVSFIFDGAKVTV
jgi:hypothetical protein